MSKHSPTPWSFQVHEDLFGGNYIVITDADGAEADVRQHYPNTETICHRVNTYPALVEALEAIIHAAQNADARDPNDSDIALGRVAAKAKAALEAAKGDQDANAE